MSIHRSSQPGLERHLLRQTNDRRVFTIIRSSSDSIPVIKWKNESSHSDANSTILAKERTSSLGHPPEEQQQSSKIQLPNRPPTYRSNKVYEVSTTVQCKIDAGLSLDLSNLFQTLTTDWTMLRKSPETRTRQPRRKIIPKAQQ